jgi:hypothetical protein
MPISGDDIDSSSHPLFLQLPWKALELIRNLDRVTTRRATHMIQSKNAGVTRTVQMHNTVAGYW